MRRYLLALVFLFLLVAEAGYAQSFYAVTRRERNLIATLGLNTATYYGDLKDNKDWLDAKPSLSLGLQHYLTPRIGLRGEFSWITLSGDDATSDDQGKIQRNLSFTSGNYEFNVSGLVNLIPQGQRFYQRPYVNLYGFAGIGGLYFNPKGKLDGKKYALQPLKTEGVEYSRFAFVIPFGLGAKIRLDPFWNLSLEAGWRKTFTDYIDDVSTVYLDNASITDPIARQLADRRPEIGLPLLEEGRKRGEPSNNDSYMLLTAKVEYYLPYQLGKQYNRKLYRSKRKPYYRRRR
jgi:hypothetical protein